MQMQMQMGSFICGKFSALWYHHASHRAALMALLRASNDGLRLVRTNWFANIVEPQQKFDMERREEHMPVWDFLKKRPASWLTDYTTFQRYNLSTSCFYGQ